MAQENYAVAVPGSMVFRNIRMSDNHLQNEQTSVVQGARFASKWRDGNWDRPKPAILRPTPYDLEHYVTRMPHGKSVIWYPQWDLRQEYDGALQMGQPSWEPKSFINDLRNEALIDALQNLKDQNFNAGVAIAEASGTAKMAVGVMQSVSRIRRDFLNGKYERAYQRFCLDFDYEDWKTWARRQFGSSKSRVKHLSKVPNAWLYYHFGIAPTLADIHAAHEDWFRRNAVPGSETRHSVVRGQAKHVTRRRGTWFTSHFCKTDDMAMEDVQSMRVYLHVTPKDEYYARLSQLGVMNWPEAAWNAVPFSWMVDYFTSMGDWLSVLDAGMGYEFGNTTESYRRICRYSATKFHSSNESGTGSCVATPYSVRWTKLQRRIVGELYPPMYRVLPRVKLKGPSVKQFSNVLSVLAGLFSGHGTSQSRT